MKPAIVVVRWARLNPHDDALLESHRVALLAAGASFDVPPDTLSLAHRCPRCGSRSHGQPLIEGRPVAVTLSRTPGAVIAAACTSEAVTGLGVDVETCSREVDGLRPIALSPTELARPESADHDHNSLRTWVRKEAILKALGTGLAIDPRSVTLEGTTVIAGPPGPWWMHDVSLADGLIASVAARGVLSAELNLGEATAR